MAEPSDAIDTGWARSVPLPSGEDMASYTSDRFIVGQTRDKHLRFNGLGRPSGVLLQLVAPALEQRDDLYGWAGTSGRMILKIAVPHPCAVSKGAGFRSTSGIDS